MKSRETFRLDANTIRPEDGFGRANNQGAVGFSGDGMVRRALNIFFPSERLIEPSPILTTRRITPIDDSGGLQCDCIAFGDCLAVDYRESWMTE